MTKKELRRKTEEILKDVQLNPDGVQSVSRIFQHRSFWEGKRIAIMEILDIDIALRRKEFPLPWEELYWRK